MRKFSPFCDTAFLNAATNPRSIGNGVELARRTGLPVASHQTCLGDLL
jgi:hypothetical protein